MDNNNPNGWAEYRQLFLADRAENTKRFDALDAKLDEVTATLAGMEAKNKEVKWWGNMFIPAVIAAVIAYLTGKVQ